MPPELDPALDAHLRRLDALGWFSQYTQGDPRAACVELFEDGVPARWCLPSFMLDVECVYSEGIHTEIVQELVASSYGLLHVERVVETWGGDERCWPFDAPITVELHLASGEVLSASWVQESDVVSDAFANVLVDLVERHGVVIEQVEPGQWIVGQAGLVDEVLRMGRRLERQERVRTPPPEPAPVSVPTTATAEERRA